MPEPGRRIVAEELASGGSALPWIDAAAFAKRAITVALEDRRAAPLAGDWVFFDRCLVDAAAALQHLTGEPALPPLRHDHRYHRRVFFVPPWPEIYAPDAERRHGLPEAMAEYERLLDAYRYLGYEAVILERTEVETRADFVMASLSG